jgi:hypothetical protein
MSAERTLRHTLPPAKRWVLPTKSFLTPRVPRNAPEIHGKYLYLFRNSQTNQVVYSLTSKFNVCLALHGTLLFRN